MNFQKQIARFIVFAILFFLLGSATKSQDTETKYLRLTVTDRNGKLISGLTKENFIIELNDEKKDVAFFDSSDQPASIFILLDISESIESRIKSIYSKSVSDLIEKSNQKNEYKIMAFGKRSQVLAGWAEPGPELAKAIQGIKSVESVGG